MCQIDFTRRATPAVGDERASKPTGSQHWTGGNKPMTGSQHQDGMETQSSDAPNGWQQACVTIKNPLGMHARPAMSFVDLANAMACEIRVSKGDQDVDGKSIMQMMMLAATQGTELVIRTKGQGADEALQKLRDLVDRSFDEEE